MWAEQGYGQDHEAGERELGGGEADGVEAGELGLGDGGGDGVSGAGERDEENADEVGLERGSC